MNFMQINISHHFHNNSLTPNIIVFDNLQYTYVISLKVFRNCIMENITLFFYRGEKGLSTSYENHAVQNVAAKANYSLLISHICFVFSQFMKCIDINSFQPQNNWSF